MKTERHAFPRRNTGLAAAASLVLAVLLVGEVISQAVAQTPVQPPGSIRAQNQDVQGGQQIPPPQQRRDNQRADPRVEMRKLVQSAANYARQLNRNFIVVAQDGLELLEAPDPRDITRQVPAANYIRALDAIMVTGLRFVPGEDGGTEPADDNIMEERLRLAGIAKRRGLEVLVTDFADTPKLIDQSIRANRAQGFVAFAASNGMQFNRLPGFPRRPVDENPKNITDIKSAQNFVVITDSSGWGNAEEFVLSLNGTNFDAVVVDVLHRGRVPFTRQQVDGMKYKKLGARRLVLAQMEIGHAETYRYYWQPGWGEGSPPWIEAPVAGRTDQYNVIYWSQAWQQLMFGNNKSYLYGLAYQGYDGVVLTGLDAFRFFEGGVR